jgi:hypothetical protein
MRAKSVGGGCDWKDGSAIVMCAAEVVGCSYTAYKRRSGYVVRYIQVKGVCTATSSRSSSRRSDYCATSCGEVVSPSAGFERSLALG